MGARAISPGERRRLAAVFDRIIPADDWPAVSEAGLFPYLTRLGDEAATAIDLEEIRALVVTIDERARDEYGAEVNELSGSELDALIAALDWPQRDRLTQAAARAFYGSRDSAGATMIGFRPGGSRDPGAEPYEPDLPTEELADIASTWDVVVVGAGAGGGVAAEVLAEGGSRVLLVDRGRVVRSVDDPRDHLRNHRSSIHGHSTGPGAGNPRVRVDRSGKEQVVDAPHDPRWHNNAMVVGGGTRVYQGMAWRFLPDDFRMASLYGVPEGSSLADWPLGYDDLEPHYDWVEWEVGVCGEASGHRAGGRRTRGYPMPPFPPNTEAQILGRGAAALGLSTGPVPLLINSEPRAGRPQCIRCGECVGFACPVGAKNGTYDSAIPRALATGHATLIAGVRATSVRTDASGHVDGVDLIDEATGIRRTVRAGHVVVACGAIESARLLLASTGPSHPAGLGNETDQVGRHLQGHGFVSAFGRFDHEVTDADGPGVSIATLDHAHGTPGIVGGGVLANEITKLPIVHWSWSLDPATPRWGADAKAAMRETYRTTSHLFGQVQEIPRADNRITLSETADAHGQPVARLDGHAHPETVRTEEAVARAAVRWLEASGANRTWIDRIPAGLLAGQHQAGTCRMGTDPSTSVVDPDGRVHGHDNLWIADASVHVTNGSVNPVLTIMALAHRIAGRLLASS